MPIEIESPEQLGYSAITNNLSESSVADRRLGDLGLDIDLDRLLLCYGDHLGDPVLREAVAAQGSGLAPGDVLVTPGAAAALFCVATAILDPGDHLVVIRTNYATNLETPRAINAVGWAVTTGPALRELLLAANTWGPVTGSRSATATSGWATAGPPRRSCATAWPG